MLHYYRWVRLRSFNFQHLQLTVVALLYRLRPKMLLLFRLAMVDFVLWPNTHGAISCCCSNLTGQTSCWPIRTSALTTRASEWKWSRHSRKTGPHTLRASLTILLAVLQWVVLILSLRCRSMIGILIHMAGVYATYLQETLLTLARTCYFPILERTWGGGCNPPMPFRPKLR